MKIPLQSAPITRGYRAVTGIVRGVVASGLEECKKCCSICKSSYSSDPVRLKACYQTCEEDYGGWCRCDLM